MKKTGKITAVLLATAVMLSVLSFSYSACAAEGASEININCKLLDSVMQDRPWVIDTLLEDDWSGNPYAGVLAASKGPKECVMENYTGSLAFRAVVNAMEFYANAGQYFEGFANDELNDLMDKLGVGSDTEVYEAVNKYTASLGSLKYESIFNDMLIQNYESSWGTTLSDESMNYEILNQRAAVYKKLGAYQSALQDYLGLTNMHSEIVIYDPLNQASADYRVNIEKYTGHFMDAYKADLKNYLDGVVSIPGLSGKSALREKIITSGALAGLTAYEKAVASSGVETEIETIFREYMCSDTMKILSAAGKAFQIGSYSVDNAILMEALVSQKDSTVNTMKRLSDYTSDSNLAGVCSSYEKLLEEQGNEKIAAYENLASYIRQNNVVGDVVTDLAGKGLSKIYDSYSCNYLGMSDYVWVNGIAKALEIAELSVWLGEEATGFKTAAKQVFVCKYVDKIIDEAAALTREDIATYKANRTEKNAAAVINDLELLKKLRLYVQKSGYESIMGNMNSWVGALLSNDQDIDSIKKMYQKSVDVILGCTITPVGDKPLEIKDNRRFTVYNYRLADGTVTTVAAVSGKGTSQPDYSIVEADSYITGGIKISNGELNISSELSNCYIPYIDASGVTDINIAAENIVFGEIKNSGTLNINLRNDSASFEIINRITNTGSFNITGKQGGVETQSCYIIDNNSEINLKYTSLDVKGNITNNGNISGNINVCGDGTQEYQNSGFRYGRQTVMGTGTITSLAFNNFTSDGVKLGGQQTVTKSLSGVMTKLISSKNLIASGNCTIENGYFDSDLTFKDYTAESAFRIKGIGYLRNNVKFNSAAEFEEGLDIGSSTLTLNGDCNVYDDIRYSSGTITGSGWLKPHGGLYITAGSPAISKLCFAGTLPQSFTSSSAVNVGQLENLNTSPKGVYFGGTINVTGAIYQGSASHYKEGRNIVLKGDAVIGTDGFTGNISANEWTCKGTQSINGSLYTSGSIQIPAGCELDVDDYSQSSGTLDIGKNAALKSSGSYINGGTVTNAGTVSVSDDSKITGTHTGGTYAAQGSISASAAFKPDKLQFTGGLAQSFYNSAATETGTLYIGNKSKNGISFNSAVNVIGTVSQSKGTVYSGGRNIVLKGEAVVKGEPLTENISASGWTCGSDAVIGGILYTSGDIAIGDNVKLAVTEYRQSSGTLNIGEGGNLQCSGNYINGGTVTSAGTVSVSDDSKITGAHTGGTFKAKGNVDASATLKPDVLKFESKLSQSFYNSAATQTDRLEINNTSSGGFYVNSIINVVQKFDNKCKKLNNASNIRLNSDVLDKNVLDYDVCTDGEFKVSAGEEIYIKGNLILKSGARVIIEDGGKLTVKKHVSSQSSSFDIDKGGSMQINDYISSSSDTFEVDGNLIIRGDAKMSSASVSGTGLITFRGDLNVSSGTWNKPNIAFDSKFYQSVGGSTINVNNLTISNSAKSGISFSSGINCYGELTENYLKISGGSYIVKK